MHCCVLLVALNSFITSPSLSKHLNASFGSYKDFVFVMYCLMRRMSVTSNSVFSSYQLLWKEGVYVLGSGTIFT